LVEVTKTGRRALTGLWSAEIADHGSLVKPLYLVRQRRFV
jgi:hypothetical protein